MDYVMTFEELGSVFSGYEIDFDKVEPYHVEYLSVKEAHAFGQSGGVAISGPCTYNDAAAGKKQYNTELDTIDDTYASRREIPKTE